MFATGIENSYPTISVGRQDRPRRRDGEDADITERWRDDFQLVKDLGIEYLRYGPPTTRRISGPGKYDWAFTDETFGALHRHGHHADRRPVPLRRARLDRRLPERGLARAVCRVLQGVCRAAFPGSATTRRSTRSSSRRLFSAQYGWWNERLTQRPRHSCARSSTSARRTSSPCTRFWKCSRTPIFIQSESSEYFHPEKPSCSPRRDVFEREALSVARSDVRPSARRDRCTSICSTTA